MTNSLPPLSRQEKIELLELEDELERRRQERPLDYCKRHPKQISAHEATQAIRALFWGNRVGKTEWGGEEVSEYATLHHQFREMKAPFEIWAACPSFDVQESTTQVKLLRYLPAKDIKKIEYLRGRIIKRIIMKNGVNILFKSYEQGREKFQGAGVRLIWFDEEPPKDIWEECFVRVEAGQQLDVILTMTAVKGMTWVYDRIYLDTGNPDLYVSEAGWDDNPWLTEDQKNQMSRGLSAAALKVRREGKFTKRVGLVCAWWDRSLHLKHYDHLDKSWTWYECLDGGFSDPAAWLLIGVDGDNNIHVVDGYRKKRLQAKDIKEERDKRTSGLLITNGWTDNDDPRLAEDLRKEGMRLTPVVKKPNESQSWDETLSKKLDEYGTIERGTGQPRLFISDGLNEINEETGQLENWLMQEIENLVWLERVSKQGEQILPKWDDHRRFGHHFDGMRALAYFMVSYADRPNTTVRAHKPADTARLKRQHAVTR
jgi:phage terminase large subunit-like protein